MEAQADQSSESAKKVARVVAAYFNALIAAGVPPEQAATLTCSYQESLVRESLFSVRRAAGIAEVARG